MNIKSLTIISLILFLVTGTLYPQSFESKLSEAQSAYKNGELNDARMALQEALNEVNMTIGKEVLALLPKTMKDLSSDATQDDVSGTGLGYAGLYVSRTYGQAENKKSASVVIITDSPLLAGINSILSLPAIMTSGADSNQKRIKIGTYKALLQINEAEDGTKNYDVQVPFGNSLLTFHCEGYSEADVVAMANTIPVARIDEKIR
ncbi:MAG: hypothetical protein JW723_10620 [Bacteroidales bacterium]|nr:hypothetical protein [Bacteroidales bacterium]